MEGGLAVGAWSAEGVAVAEVVGGAAGVEAGRVVAGAGEGAGGEAAGVELLEAVAGVIAGCFMADLLGVVVPGGGLVLLDMTVVSPHVVVVDRPDATEGESC